MENIILSILLIKSMTIYEMRAFIQKNLSTVCSDSMGSIQSALKKLLQIKDYIEQIKNDVIRMNVERISQEPDLKNHLLDISGESTLANVVQNIFDYQLYDLHYGLKRLQDDIIFYEEIIEREENKV